jgi:quercetin dioxygenase-like cupin family protein
LTDRPNESEHGTVCDHRPGQQRTTLVLLVSGRHRVDLSTGVVVLQRPGDYVVWGPGIDHTWQTEEDSVVITVRWPSLPS